MDYTEQDLPVRLRDGELLTLADGTVLRWESNGEAKAVFVGDSFGPDVELFPSQEHCMQVGGQALTLVAFFEDALEVRKD